MKAVVIKNNYDNILKEVNIKLIDFLKNPSTLCKEDLPLWRFITLKDNAPKRRFSDNYANIHALILEFDKGMTIEEAMNTFSKYTYALHTTSTHMSSAHRFRIILPLDMEYPEMLWRLSNVKQAMKELFPALDITCFVNFQKIPAVPANPIDYVYHVNRGERFSYDVIDSRVKELDTTEELDAKLNDSIKKSNKRTFENNNLEAYKNTALANVRREYQGCGQAETGDRYLRMCSYTGKLLSMQYPDGNHMLTHEEVRSIIKCEYWDVRIAKMVRSFCTRRK